MLGRLGNFLNIRSCLNQSPIVFTLPDPLSQNGELKTMSSKNIGDVIDITESLTDGLKLDIRSVKIDTDKTGEFALIGTADGKKYRTYSTVILEMLKKVVSNKFDFKADVLKAQVKEVESQNGNTYFTLTGQSSK